VPSDPKIRASDQDRDRTAALLREHHAAGRLTLEEFNERLDQAYAAKTVGELDALMADLPAIDLYQLPDASLGRRPAADTRLPWLHPPGALMAVHGGFSRAGQVAWGSWLSLSSLCFFVWLATGASLTNPWFLWIVGPWGLLMLGRWITGPSGDAHRPGPGGGHAPGSGRQDRHDRHDRHLNYGDRRDRHRGRDRHHGRGHRDDPDRS